MAIPTAVVLLCTAVVLVAAAGLILSVLRLADDLTSIKVTTAERKELRRGSGHLQLSLRPRHLLRGFLRRSDRLLPTCLRRPRC